MALELLPTSRPPGTGPGMPASRERKQLGWQPAHSARAVSQEAGQAGLSPSLPSGALARPPALSQVSAPHQSYKGALMMPAPSRTEGWNLAGWRSRRSNPIYSAQLLTNEDLLWTQHIEQEELFKSNK